MSDRLITAEEARERLAELESMSDWTGEDRIAAEYARTVIAQDEQVETLSRLLTGAEKSTIERAGQIKRLQKAVTTLLDDLNEVELGIYRDYETPSTAPFKPHTLDEYITAEDMEADDA